MVRPVLAQSDAVAKQRRRRGKAPLIGKRPIRTFLKRNGQNHRITPSAYQSLCFIGKSIIEKIVLKVKTELQQGSKKNASPKSICKIEMTWHPPHTPLF